MDSYIVCCETLVVILKWDADLKIFQTLPDAINNWGSLDQELFEDANNIFNIIILSNPSPDILLY